MLWWLACAAPEPPAAMSMRPSYGLQAIEVGPTGLSVLDRRVRIRFDEADPEAVVAWLGALPGGAIHALDLHGLPLHGRVSALATAPVLRDVRILRLGGPDLDDADLAALAAATLPSLEELHVTDASIGDAGVRALAASGRQPALSVLGLRRNRIGADGAATIGGGPWALAALDLGWNPLGDDGVARLAAGERTAALRRLDLGSTGLGPDGVAALAPRLASVEVLSLWRNGIGDAGLRILVAHGPSLRELDLSLTGLTPSAAGALCAVVGDLDALYAYGNRIGPDGVAAIARCGGALRTLELGNNALGDPGIAALSPERLPRLEQLALWRNGITADGATGLRSRFDGSALITLNLAEN